jgi:hypothetical protein
LKNDDLTPNEIVMKSRISVDRRKIVESPFSFMWHGVSIFSIKDEGGSCLEIIRHKTDARNDPLLI